MLTTQQKQQFGEILEELGQTLDITEAQYEIAVNSYKAVGNWLSKENSELAPYEPNILPQGSFLLGTMIRPINPNDDLDIDLVCELTSKKASWTQAHLKQIVGDQLKSNETYKSMLDKEGRRCWTLKYRENSVKNDQYHLDILPAVIASGYNVILEKAFSDLQDTNVDKLAIRITDNLEDNYNTETIPDYWLKSNPFGYAKWFVNRGTISGIRMFSLNEAIKPVPKYQSNKFPLQRVVQILKRHRDMMFNGDDDKPISIIITTLASRAYNKQTNILEALMDVIDTMDLFIETKYDAEKQEYYKFIGNPVNSDENFADKWKETKQKEINFYKWLAQVKIDINNATQQRGSHYIMESLSKSFGETEVTKAFNNIGDRARLLTEQGNNRFDTKLGVMAGAANVIKPHNFYGTKE